MLTKLLRRKIGCPLNRAADLSDAYAALDSAGRTTVPGGVASAQTKAEAVIADATAKLTGGRYLEAVTAARNAVTASGKSSAPRSGTRGSDG